MGLRKQKLLEKRHQYAFPEVDYQYNRFNTKSERNTIISCPKETVILETDIQTVQIANSTLISRISSTYNTKLLEFDVLIQPFDSVLFEIEGYQHFNQEGILILGSYGAPSREVFEQMPHFEYIFQIMPDEPTAVYVAIDDFVVDNSENRVQLRGTLIDGKEFKVDLDYKNYRLTIDVPSESLKNDSNFKLFPPKSRQTDHQKAQNLRDRQTFH